MGSGSPAEVYDREIVPAVFGEWTPALVAAAKPASGESVLDLACGSGAVTRSVAPIVGPSGSVIAVDISGPMLDVARGRPVEGAPVRWLQAPADSLPVDDAHVDVLLCQQGLQFFPDPAAAAAEVARVLKPGGRAVLSVWSGLEANPVHRAFNESLLERTGAALFAAPFSFGDADRLAAVLGGAGLRVEEVRSETRRARFRSLAHFAEVNVVAAAAVIPAFASLTDDERASLVAGTIADVSELADRDADASGLAIPMTSLVAEARRPLTSS